MRKTLLICLVLSVGCEQSVQEGPEPPVFPPTIARNEPEPSPALPESPNDEPPPPPPSLVERAQEFLPPARQDLIGDFDLDGVVVRVVDSYITQGGCTVSLVLLSLDEDRLTGIVPSTALVFGSQNQNLSFVYTGDVMLDAADFDSDAILLPADVPVPVGLVWSGVGARPDLISLRFRHFAETRQFNGAVTRFAALDWDDWPAMDQAEIDASLRLLAQCNAVTPGTADWKMDPRSGGHSGAVGIEFDALPSQTGAVTGQFFLLDASGRKHAKTFSGQLLRDDDAGLVEVSIETTLRSGIQGQPTNPVSSRNLLLRGTTTSIMLRLYGHELIGRTPADIRFDISAAPFVGGISDSQGDMAD